jgi:hypothetical protein
MVAMFRKRCERPGEQEQHADQDPEQRGDDCSITRARWYS